MTEPTKAQLQAILDAMDAEAASAAVETATRVAALSNAVSRDDLLQVWESLRRDMPISDVMDIVDAYAPADTPCPYDWKGALERVIAKWGGE